MNKAKSRDAFAYAVAYKPARITGQVFVLANV